MKATRIGANEALYVRYVGPASGRVRVEVHSTRRVIVNMRDADGEELLNCRGAKSYDFLTAVTPHASFYLDIENPHGLSLAVNHGVFAQEK